VGVLTRCKFPIIAAIYYTIVVIVLFVDMAQLFIRIATDITVVEFYVRLRIHLQSFQDTVDVGKNYD
jgi:hypothetical protein